MNSQVSFWLISLSDVTPSESKFNAKFRLVYKFNSPNLKNKKPVFEAGGRKYYEQSQVEDFLPGQSVELQNAIEYSIVPPSIGNKENLGLIFSDPECQPDELKLEVVYKGTFKHLFELKKFPYDRQKLTIKCIFWRKTEADFQRSFKEFEVNEATFDKLMFDQPDYSFVGIATELSGEPCKGTLSIELKRKPWYYTISATLSLWFILTLALATYLTPLNDMGDKFSDTITLLLTIVAVKFVISSDVPKVPYFTNIDIEIFLSFFFLLFVTFSHTQIISISTNIFYFKISVAIYACIIFVMLLSPIRYLLKSRKDKVM